MKIWISMKDLLSQNPVASEQMSVVKHVSIPGG